MAGKQIYITDYDLHRLRKLLETRPVSVSQGHLADLKGELDRAVIVPHNQIPPDIVTMNSRFILRDLDTGIAAEYTLVFPGKANIRDGRLSILAPIGTAILGCREYEKVEWKVPAGIKHFRVDEILYQPEAAEDFHL